MNSYYQLQILSWSGSILGLIGAYVLAANRHFSKWGWVLFLASNLACLLYFWWTSQVSMLVFQIGLIGSTLIGIRNHFSLRFSWAFGFRVVPTGCETIDGEQGRVEEVAEDI